MPINESVYGARENWYVPGNRTELGHQYSGDAYYYNDIASDDKLKIKVANFNTLSNPVTSFCSQMDGEYPNESYLIRNNWKSTQTDPIDRSIVQFGIGPQSGLADIEWWGVEWVTGQSEPTSSVDPTMLNHDKYDIVNIGLGLNNEYIPPMNYSAGNAANTTTGDMLITGAQYINRQIWGDQRCYFSTDSDSFYNYHIASAYAFTNFITQIPIKNLKIYPRITAYKSDTHWKQFNSIQDYLAEKNDYPLLGCIEAIFQYRSGINNTTEYSSSASITPIFTDKTTVLKGYQNGTGNDQVIRDENLWYCRNWRRHFVVAGRYGYDRSGSYGMMNDIYWAATYDSRPYTYAIFDAVYQTPDFKFTLNANKCFTCDVSSMTDDQITEGIRKQLASFGMFFVDDIDDINLALDDEKTFLGILKNGVGYGDYSNGAKNREQDQWNWDSMEENTYDPENPPSPIEPGDDPAASGDPLLPVGLEWTLAGAGTGIWALTPSNITQIWDDIFGQDINVKQFGDNPMNAILSLEWTPFVWEGGTPGPVILGSTIVNPAHTYPKIATVSHAEVHGYGQMRFEYNKNFYNSRNIQARLFLPFYGYYELPAAQLLSSQLRVDFYYNIPDELGTYIISYDKVIYDFVECNCKIEIPVTGSNAAAIKENKKQQALSIATQVASMAATVATTGLGFGLSGAGSTLAAVYSGAGNITDTIASIPWLEGAEFTSVLAGGAAIGAGAGSLGKQGIGAYNTVNNAKIQRAALRTNLPYHGSASQTTFLHMSMTPYVQIFKNAIISGLTTSEGGTIKEELGGTSKAEYMLKVGHACDTFATIDKMPADSLLQTTGMANMSTEGMELAEVNELNAILQSGFYK